MIEELHRKPLKIELIKNFSKTKLMSNKVDKPMIKIQGTEIEHANEYTYLDQNIKVSKENQTTKISRRVKMGLHTYLKINIYLNDCELKCLIPVSYLYLYMEPKPGHLLK
ncbi:unnamed protein product [Diabrotica balteata]|uniref:Uncharacterized protein n=1 Tax=Diabrotica balteata TaxID=107213 RepID=A0A9N9XGC2_DIABA|nr:unnamed protein product [Diabrotica balteata]